MRNRPPIWAHILVALVLVALGAAGLAALTMSKPPLAKQQPQPVLPTVRTTSVELAPHPVMVEGEGTVQPRRRSSLASQVAGRVVEVSPHLEDGGMVQADEVLVRVDPSDYELAVTLAQAKVREAQTNLKKVQEDAEASLEEWRRVQGRGEPPALVAREPQLAEARAKLKAARAELAKAELNLSRTEIAAPFAGRISAKHVDLGQYLRAGDKVADLYGIDTAEVVVHLEDSALAWLKVPGLTVAQGPGSAAEVFVGFGGQRIFWQGRVDRALGELDPRTRLVPVVVQVPEPFRRQPPLAPGLFVKVRIAGETLQRAAVLPRAALRADDTVWVVDENGVLRFRPVEVARTSGERVLISGGLAPGERVVVSNLQAVSDGMLVRVAAPGQSRRAGAAEEQSS
jgi:RND family efflux transporter MFP subunit